MKHLWWYVLASSCFIIILMLLCGLLIMYNLCPLFGNFPQPTGQYAIGIDRFHVVDERRIDDRQLSGIREFMFDVLYPSSSPDKNRQFPYHPAKLKALAQIKTRRTLLPLWVWSLLLQGITSYAEPQAPVAMYGAPFPLVIFLPGIAGDAFYHVYLEELASQGIIIAVLEPPFDVSVSIFPNNRIVGLDTTFQKSIDEGNRDAIYAYRERAHAEWLKDIKAVIKKIRIVTNNQKSPFYKKIDMTRIGLLGHSHGGGVATDFCAQSKHCLAGVNMDGWTKNANTTTGFKKPFLFLVNENGMDELTQLAKNMGSYGTLKKIPGAGHRAFSDMILIKQPLRWYLAPVTGDLDMVRRNIQHNLTTFFNKKLKKSEQNRELA